jgi:hypothetical protein
MADVKISYTVGCQHDPLQGLIILTQKGYDVHTGDGGRTQFVTIPGDVDPKSVFSPSHVAELQKLGINVEFLT